MRRPESPNDRIEDYFFEMKDVFDNNGIYSVYVIHLDDEIKQKWDSRGKKSAFPRGKYQNLESKGLVTHQGCVYVGYTGKDLETRFSEHIRGINCQNKIVTDFRISDDYSEAMMDDEFLITGIESQEIAMKLESWYGWALYKAGYMVWGPHFHREEDFLLYSPFW